MNIILFLLPAFIACLILTGIHTYLGLHVLSRGIIFVDIALAQIAALGITVALWAGFEPDSQTSYLFALGFTLLDALFLSSFRDKKLSLEAAIGVTFAFTSALSVLISDRIPHGSEHLKFILNGNILWVGWMELLKTFFIYLVIGLFHFKYRQIFTALSKKQTTKINGHRAWIWDLLFYLSFGLVITSSVQIAGILLVFSFLIVPSLISQLFLDGFKQRLLFGWVLGVLVSIAGIYLSYHLDLPTGATIVGCFGFCFILSLILRIFFAQVLTQV